MTTIRRTRALHSVTLYALFAIAAASCASAPADVATTTAPTAAPVVAQTPARHAEPVRAMTFNIRYGTAPDGEHEWPLRRHLTFRAISEFAPTVLGVQEALRFQLDEIGAELPHLVRIGVGRDDGEEAGEYSAILYDRRRLDVIDQGTFWLSNTPNVPGSKSWGNYFPRIVTWARFRDLVSDAGFYVFNTHWDHESQAAREASAALLIERIRDRVALDEPVIVMGDFNAGEDNAAFQSLVEQRDVDEASIRLYDTFRAVRYDAGDTGTFHAFTGDRSGPKIDAILASPEWQTLDAAIVRLSENGVYPSDHFPVTAVLWLGARGPP